MEPMIWRVVGGGGGGGVGVRCKASVFHCGMRSARHFWARAVRMGIRVGWDVIVPAMVGGRGEVMVGCEMWIGS